MSEYYKPPDLVDYYKPHKKPMNYFDSKLGKYFDAEPENYYSSEPFAFLTLKHLNDDNEPLNEQTKDLRNKNLSHTAQERFYQSTKEESTKQTTSTTTGIPRNGLKDPYDPR